jgi:hypothetical protein
MDFAPPTSCVNPEAFTDNGDEPDCEWEELRQQAGDQWCAVMARKRIGKSPTRKGTE